MTWRLHHEWPGVSGHSSQRDTIAASRGEALLWELQMFGLLLGAIRGRGKPDLEGSYLSAKEFPVYLKVDGGLLKALPPLGMFEVIWSDFTQERIPLQRDIWDAPGAGPEAAKTSVACTGLTQLPRPPKRMESGGCIGEILVKVRGFHDGKL